MPNPPVSDVPNPPRRHHYVPRFYLSRWAIGSDHRLCEFSRPYKTIKPKRRHPSETGYVDRLYELKGIEGPLSQVLESKFFSPVDSAAAAALALMEMNGNLARWNDSLRSGWAQFLHSMLLRMPEDLSLFERSWRELMLSDNPDHWEERYRRVRRSSDPPTYRAYMASVPLEDHNRAALHALTKMMASVNVGRKVTNMLWWIMDTSSSDYPLLTSDRPIIRSNGLNAPNGHLAMPIGPHKLFLAAKDRDILNSLVGLGPKFLVRETNRQVVKHAAKLVYAVDDQQLTFITKHFGTDPDIRLIDSAVRNLDEIKNRIVIPNHRKP